MSIRRHPTKGANWWQILEEGRTADGKRKQKYFPFHGSEAEARVVDARLNNKVPDVQYPTILSILERFLEHYQNNTQPHSYLAMNGALKHLLPYYGEMRIPLIANHHHEEYKTLRMSQHYLPGKAWQLPSADTPEEAAKRRPMAKSSINREINCLKALLSYAKEQGISVSSAPNLFPKRQSTGKAILPMSPVEISSLFSVLDGYQLTLAMLMFWGGLRLKEATNLRWEDVDISNAIIMVRGKGGSIAPIPILGNLLPHLSSLHKPQAKGYICINPQSGKPYGNIMKALRTAALRVGITKHIDHHLLRHTAGTCLMLAGTQQRGVQGLLRHQSIETTSIYTHLAAQFLTTEGSKLSDLMRVISVTDKASKVSSNAA